MIYHTLNYWGSKFSFFRPLALCVCFSLSWNRQIISGPMGYGLPVARRGPERPFGMATILGGESSRFKRPSVGAWEMTGMMWTVPCRMFFFANAMAARCVLRCGKSPHSWVKGVVKRRIFLGDFSCFERMGQYLKKNPRPNINFFCGRCIVRLPFLVADIACDIPAFAGYSAKTNTRVYIYIYIHVYIYVYICIYIYTSYPFPPNNKHPSRNHGFSRWFPHHWLTIPGLVLGPEGVPPGAGRFSKRWDDGMTGWDLPSGNIWYPLVIKRSYWKWPFMVDFPIQNGDFP